MMMGAIAGVVAKRAITDNHPAPLILPKKHSITVLDDGIYLLDVEFDVPYPPLVVDAGGGKYNNVNGLQVNYGFSIKSTGKDVIEQVYVKRQNHVVFVCSENPTGLTLAYANTGTRGGGNIRDSQGDNILININGTSTPVHNWMPIFEITI